MAREYHVTVRPCSDRRGPVKVRVNGAPRRDGTVPVKHGLGPSGGTLAADGSTVSYRYFGWQDVPVHTADACPDRH